MAAPGEQIVGILQKMMKEVSETIKQASDQLGNVEVSRAFAPPAKSTHADPTTRCRADACRGRR